MNRLLVEQAAHRAGIELSVGMTEQVCEFIELLKETNDKINLTAITDDEAIATLHLEDSWRVSAHIPENATLIDIGTGAGFPGLALRIVRPDLDVTLVDATLKKVTFLQKVIDLLELDATTALHARAEDLGRDQDFRDCYDVAVARAVTALPVLSELCLPLVKRGGRLIAMKGSDDQTAQSKRAIRMLGGELEEVIRYELPGMDWPRSLVIISKKEMTAFRYPRRMVTIRNSPL